MLRVCNECNIEKPLELFVKNSKCSEGRTGKCRECHNKRQNIRARNNPNTKANRLRSSHKIKKLNRERIVEYHGGFLQCENCKMSSEIQDVFDYHHIDGATKEYTISSIMDWKWDTIKEEIDKCVLLCANCHRIRHYKERK